MNDLQKRFETEIKELLEACQRLSDLRYGAGSGGNVSYRVDEDLVLITPTGMVKRKIRFEDICIVHMDGSPAYVPEGRRPTGEMFMHLHIYRKRPDVKGIMHAHPPLVVGVSMTEQCRDMMKLPVLPDAATFLGPILTIPYVRPNSDELGYSFDPYLPHGNAFIMSNHGCLVCSANGVKNTVDACQVLEAQAKVSLLASMMGEKPRILNDRDMHGMDLLLEHRGERMPGPPKAYADMKTMFEAVENL